LKSKLINANKLYNMRKKLDVLIVKQEQEDAWQYTNQKFNVFDLIS